MTENKQTKEIVVKFCKAMADRDLEVLLGCFSKIVDWDIPGNEQLAPWLGKRTNIEEIKTFFELLWLHTKPLFVQIAHILDDGGFAIITGEFSTRMLKTGKIVNSVFSIHLTIKAGLIIKYRLQEDSFAVAMALQV